MRKFNKTITLLSAITIPALAISTTLTGCSDTSREVHILDINDIHGAMAGWGEEIVDVGATKPGCLRLAREVNKVIDQYPGSIFLSAGDENSGDSWSVCTKGESTYPILKAMDVRYCAVGNHAFEWSLDDMAGLKYDKLGRTDKTEGNYFVASNILNTNTYQNKEWCLDPKQEQFLTDFQIWQNQRVSWADPYKILNLSGLNVCIIGLTTDNTLIDGNKKYTNQFSFINYNAAVHYTKYLIEQEKGKSTLNNIDSFILLTHMGSSYTDKILNGEAVDLAATIDTDIDAIISAHSHKSGSGKIWNNKLDKPICVGQAGTAGAQFLDTKLVFNPKAAAGKKLQSIGMSVKNVPCPDADHKEEAQTEWQNLLKTTDPKLMKVAEAFKQQCKIVGPKISEVLSECILEQNTDQMQYPDKFPGYYNGTKHQEAGWHVGHHYYDCPDILDHFGAWYARACMIGFDINHWDEIKKGEVPIPSACFSTQDSAPAQLQLGNISLRELFNMQPYDNTGRIVFLSVYQLANIFNYLLSGKPDATGTKGFYYDNNRHYKPSLTHFPQITSTTSPTNPPELTRVAFSIKNEKDKSKFDVDSCYTCGPLMWYGVQVTLEKIDDTPSGEREIYYEVDNKKYPLYDETATYKVATEEKQVKIAGETKTLCVPKLKIYDGSELNFGTMDNPALWHDADWWLEKEYPDPTTGAEPKLIPVLISNFMYDDGNEQNKMFKRYGEYNTLTKSFKFSHYESSETIRDDITAFCRYSTPGAHEWTEFEVPTNLVWSKVKALVIK